MTVVRLFSDGLLSKWGFGDGDAPEEWLDWCDEHDIDYNRLRGWRDEILPELVRRYLLPVLGQRVTLTQISTIHNPIRATTVNGQDVKPYWYEPDDPPFKLTPEYVEVPMVEVLRLAEAATGN